MGRRRSHGPSDAIGTDGSSSQTDADKFFASIKPIRTDADAQQVVTGKGFVLTLPAGWMQSKTLPEGMDAGYQKTLAPGDDATFQFHCELLSMEDPDPSSDTPRMKAQWDILIRKMYPDARTVDGETPKVTGKIVIHAIYDFTDGGMPLRRRYTYFFAGTTAFAVQCTAPLARWAAVLADFDAILASLKPGGSPLVHEKQSDQSVRARYKTHRGTGGYVSA